MGFGKLRVVNDDVVAPGQGFGTHPHDNMEIVSVPLSGSLRHQDSMGNVHVIRNGEIQIMSAGTGIMHSEYNNSDVEPVNFLQIWVLPKAANIEPRYGQKAITPTTTKNRFQIVVSPDGRGESAVINQDAWFSLADLDVDTRVSYALNRAGDGAYFFVIDGTIRLAGETLNRRDGIGLSGIETVEVLALDESRVLCIEVPMK
jgi:redox-sensitive bicupin YhaK (pirin superfamily)